MLKCVAVVILLATLCVCASGPRSALVQWTANPAAELVTQYRVYQGTSAAGPFSLVASSGSTNAVVSGLGPGAYYFVVTAVNAGGESDPSDQAILPALPSKVGTVTTSGLITLTNVIVIPIN